MSEESSDGHPVLAGLAALVGVGLVVGLIFGAATVGVTRVLGVSGSEGNATARATSAETLVLPDPEPTDRDTGPAFTFDAEPSTPADEETEEEVEEEDEIALSAGQNSVSSMQRIDLTGVYPGGEGAILMVQRFENDSWTDFGVTVSVRGETFSTYIQTGRAGVNRFRVRDTDADLASNDVRVTVN